MQKVNLDYVLKYLEDNFGSAEVLRFIDDAVGEKEIDEEQ